MSETPSTSEDSGPSDDEEWKARVRGENAELESERNDSAEPVADAETPQDSDTSTTADPETDPTADMPPWPAPEFYDLITMCASSAMVGLGMASRPGSDAPTVDLPLARHFIDLLDVLEKKTAGNLEPKEAATLHATLHDLRMQFLQKEPSDATG